MEIIPKKNLDSESGVVLVEYAVLFAFVVVFFGIMITGLFRRDDQGNLVRDNDGNLILVENIVLLEREDRVNKVDKFHFYTEISNDPNKRDVDPRNNRGDIVIPNPLHGFSAYFQRITDFLALPIP